MGFYGFGIGVCSCVDVTLPLSMVDGVPYTTFASPFRLLLQQRVHKPCTPMCIPECWALAVLSRGG